MDEPESAKTILNGWNFSRNFLSKVVLHDELNRNLRTAGAAVQFQSC